MIHVDKMHSCGNDYCLVSYNPNIDYKDLAIRICNRKTGVGADGLIVAKAGKVMEMIVYNSDGSRASQSGNGIMCFTKYCLKNGYLRRNMLELLTTDGIKSIEVTNENPFQCKIAMGMPFYNNPMLYINDPLDSFGRVIKLSDGTTTTIYALAIGTVNAIIFVDSFNDKILSYAEEISNHKLFIRRANVNFVHVIDKNNIEIRFYEIGVGWTLSSGTGATAAALASYRAGLCDKKIICQLELGRLAVDCLKKETYLSGPASLVFECNYKEEE